MKVILKQSVEGLGKAGDLLTVADGYARNYLVPRRLVVQATSSNLTAYEEEKQQRLRRENKEKRGAETLAKELEKISCTATVSVGEEDKMFGSVTSQTIAELLKEKGYTIDRRKILLEEPIKALGVYTVPIRLHSEIDVKIKVWVVKE
ncbi:MAG: 50S ribosomal protein L9 [Candidatus Latescibacteria bacterium]|nr:50S ribosomal protein L9 [Candidatus Latescibacterota bacterium]